MHSRSKLLPSLSIALLLAGIISQAASCTLDQNGTLPPEEVQACQTADTCPDDKNQCTLNTCSDGKVCEYKPIEGIAPEQTAGDCQQGTCANGVFSEIQDNSDLPDDNESCTNDSCVDGAPTHESFADGTSCTVGEAAGLCKSGKCTIECDAQKKCDDMNPCTQDTCNASTGTCSFSPLDGLPTPGATAIAGDCSQQICVNGVDTAIKDNADLPNDDNTCTKDTCVDGMPGNTVISTSGLCIASGTMGVCNVVGDCVQCNVAQDCPDPANPCKLRTCTNNVCGTSNVPASDLPPTAGDCKKSSCDGNGNVVVTNDNADIPVDGNLCTKDVCTNGTPSNPPEPNTQSCGAGGQLCDGLGQCIGCTTATECGTNTLCTTYTCVMSKCVIDHAPAGTSLPMDQQKPEDCLVLQCDGAGNTIVSIDTMDAPDDKNACTQNRCDSAGMPTYPPEPVNSVCADKGGTVCDGLGKCVKAPGADCVDAADCVTGFCTDGVCCMDTCTTGCMACNVSGSLGICSNVPSNQDDAPSCTGTSSCDGMGVCKRDNGQPCGMNAECSSGFCADGVCCNTACTDSCKSCNVTGTVGTCSNVPYDTVDPGGPMPCSGSYKCDGNGVCKALNTLPCMMASECLSGNCVDGYCCNNACTQECKACSQALTGLPNGQCQNIINGTDPDNECTNGECNGGGSCSGGGGGQTNGTACTKGNQCASGFCTDGVCCNTACMETCKTCNRSGLVGTCSDVPNTIQDPNATTPCTNTSQCDGLGVCKLLNSQPCMMPSQCLSGYCADGYCCGNICTQLCMACSLMLNGVANGSCQFVPNGGDPQNECTGASTCNGAGMCTP